MQAITAQTASHTKSGSGVPADFAANVIAKAVTARKPRTRYAVGRDAALLPLVHMVPDRTLDRLLVAALLPHFQDEDEHHVKLAFSRRRHGSSDARPNQGLSWWNAANRARWYSRSSSSCSTPRATATPKYTASLRSRWRINWTSVVSSTSTAAPPSAR